MVAFWELEKTGLGKLVEMKAQRGTACISVCHSQIVLKSMEMCQRSLLCYL